jgi:hypothetical protein
MGEPRLTVRTIARSFDVSPSGVVIGSAERCAVRDTDSSVQPNHCRLFRESEGVWSIEDLNSTGGTFVNGRRISGVERVVHGDLIRCAQSSLELLFETGASAPRLADTRASDVEMLRGLLEKRAKTIVELEAQLARAREQLEASEARNEDVARKLVSAEERHELAASSLRHELAELRIRHERTLQALDDAERRAATNDELIAQLREVIDELQRRRDGVEV